MSLNVKLHLKRPILTILTVLSLALLPAGAFVVGDASASAAAPAASATTATCPSSSSASTPQQQVLSSVGEAGGNCSETQVTTTISSAVTVLSYVAGVAAIIMIILSGFRYITSAGDSGKVSSAKNTLIYALIGLVIAVLAQFLVRFVLTQADTSTSSTASPPSSSTAKPPQSKQSTATGGTAAP